MALSIGGRFNPPPNVGAGLFGLMTILTAAFAVRGNGSGAYGNHGSGKVDPMYAAGYADAEAGKCLIHIAT